MMKQYYSDRQVYVIAVILLLCLGLVATALLSVQTARAQGQNGITEPIEGDVLSGVVIVRGTATDPQFLRYELAFNRGGDWIVFAEGDQAVTNNTLAIWDTTVGQPGNPVFPDGNYQLRLRVVRQDYNYDEYVVRNLTVENSGTQTPTPTATVEGTPPAARPTATPGEATPSNALDPGRPTALPTLTPFVTPSISTPEGNVITATDGDGPRRPPTTEDEGGLLARVAAIELGRFSQAFWSGARISAYLFALLPLYLLVRLVVRRLWRIFLKRISS